MSGCPFRKVLKESEVKFEFFQGFWASRCLSRRPECPDVRQFAWNSMSRSFQIQNFFCLSVYPYIPMSIDSSLFPANSTDRLPCSKWHSRPIRCWRASIHSDSAENREWGVESEKYWNFQPKILNFLIPDIQNRRLDDDGTTACPVYSTPRRNERIEGNCEDATGRVFESSIWSWGTSDGNSEAEIGEFRVESEGNWRKMRKIWKLSVCVSGRSTRMSRCSPSLVWIPPSVCLCVQKRLPDVRMSIFSYFFESFSPKFQDYLSFFVYRSFRMSVCVSVHPNVH